jgi:hypothetical protein
VHDGGCDDNHPRDDDGVGVGNAEALVGGGGKANDHHGGTGKDEDAARGTIQLCTGDRKAASGWDRLQADVVKGALEFRDVAPGGVEFECEHERGKSEPAHG